MNQLRLAVLRHAKSSWSDESISDHDRPLNGRGREAAPRVGQELADRGWVPNLVLCSSARRTQETWQLASAQLPPVAEVRILRELYLPSLETLVSVLRTVQDEQTTVLLVGHNPGCELLANRLLHEPLTFKTAEAALLTTHADDWYSALASSHLWQLDHKITRAELDD
ncbi:MAG: histidine phosphatase family protein [Pirellulales bacterium]